MKTTTATRLLLTCMLATAASASFAEDIDIYSQNTSITPGAPNVLLVMDNTGNWGQSFGTLGAGHDFDSIIQRALPISELN